MIVQDSVGRDWTIRFQYDDPFTLAHEGAVPKLNRRRVTTCRVFLTSEEGRTPIAELIGSTRCSRRDQFEKSKGRKIALTAALSSLSKDMRSDLWAAYWKKIGRR